MGEILMSNPYDCSIKYAQKRDEYTKIREVYNAPPTGLLQRVEKLAIINSVIQGVGSSATFDVDVLQARIEACLKLAEEILNVKHSP